MPDQLPDSPEDFTDLLHQQLDEASDGSPSTSIIQPDSPLLEAIGFVQPSEARSKTFRFKTPLEFKPGGAPKLHNATITAVSVRQKDASTSSRMTVAFNIHSSGRTTWKTFWNSEVSCDAMLLDRGGGVLEHRRFTFQIYCSDRGKPKVELFNITPDVFEAAQGARIYLEGRFKRC